jgi:hypothetical protein
MGAFDLIKNLQKCGVSLEANGSTLLVSPKSALNENLRNQIRDNKFALLEALGTASPYWLVGDELVITSAPPLTLAEVQSKYPGQVCKPLAEHTPRSKPVQKNTLKVDQLSQRIENLRGNFYDDEDIVFALRWLASCSDTTELEKLIVDAENQISQLKNNQTT